MKKLHFLGKIHKEVGIIMLSDKKIAHVYSFEFSLIGATVMVKLIMSREINKDEWYTLHYRNSSMLFKVKFIEEAEDMFLILKGHIL